MLFRIEDVLGGSLDLRECRSDKFTVHTVEKAGIDRHIASVIREKVNGADKREMLSYSMSLAACLLKYNESAGNELHICVPNRMDYISYISPKKKEKARGYSIAERLMSTEPLFRKDGEISLRGFVVDVSNNAQLDQYLRKYTGKGRKTYASPEKDREVVVMNPPNDKVIHEYMDAVYALYGLQMKYHFLVDARIKSALLSDMMKDEHCFMGAPEEGKAFVFLIHYLSGCWEYERRISSRIYNYFEKKEHESFCFDGILQLDSIQKNTFEEACDLWFHYNAQPLPQLFWKHCRTYLQNSPETLRNETGNL